mgnify:CR=1 FL=1
MVPTLRYDHEADAAYVTLRDLPYAYGEDIDHERRIDYAAGGTPIGIELLCVSQGVNLDDLPEHATVARLLVANRIKIFA